MNLYKTMKNQHQAEVNAFPMAFAFSQKQFVEGMAKLGLKPEETDKIYKLGSTGGFYLKSDAPALKEMFDRHGKELQDAIDNDKKGDGFIFDMFDYELSNHEYTHTGDVTDALNALDLSWEDIGASKKLARGLKKAIKLQKDWAALHN